jgi:hypothetical protein
VAAAIAFSSLSDDRAKVVDSSLSQIVQLEALRCGDLGTKELCSGVVTFKE